MDYGPMGSACGAWLSCSVANRSTMANQNLAWTVKLTDLGKELWSLQRHLYPKMVLHTLLHTYSYSRTFNSLVVDPSN